MSNTSIIEAEQQPAPRSAEPSPRRPSPRSRRLGEALLAWLDVFLSESLRRASPEEVSRCRLLVGIALGLLWMDVLILLLLPISPRPWVHGPLALTTALGFMSALVLLRQRSSYKLAALSVCVTFTVTFMFTSIVTRIPYTASHASVMLLPALAVYLMGARLGLGLTVLMALFVGLVHPVYYLSPGIMDPPPAAGDLWMRDLLCAVCMLGIWGVSWLHTTAREQAHAAREQALRTLRESERKLSSLIENTSDLVCSVDTEGRLVIANSAMRRAYQERYGKEPVPGEPLISPEPAEKYARWRNNLEQAFAGQKVRSEDVYQTGDRVRVVDISYSPVFGEDGRPLGLTLFGRDVTERKEAESKLSELHRTLLDVSRQAGMAEVATGLLHNVGNTLNSVNVSANLVTEGLQRSRVAGLARAAELLREHSEDLPSFFRTDPRGRQLPDYLIALSEQLAEERRSLLAEQRLLTEGLEHVKSIINMQQEHARFSGMVESVHVPRLIDDGLRLHAASFERLGIALHREYIEVPPILLDRHKLLQILINLLSNARHALLDSERPDKRITIRITQVPEERLRIQMSDNGVGIPPEILARLFTQGFTTKKDGHGFGLHISALAAAELQGSLTCASEGRGHGATFTLELPMRREAAPA